MKNIKQINENLAVATEQLSAQQLQQAAQAGYKSVLNLRSPQEEGFLEDEAQQAKAAGLDYVNIPVKPNHISEELALRVLQQIDQLPKPLLTHCRSGLRAGAFSLMYFATREKISAAQAMEKGKQMGFDCSQSPDMKEFFQQYISKHQSAK
ncbi:MAG: protein tyrosine phosphatase family protein [Microcoleaceae cyanobacterium]